jgi:hypothetical protein
MNSFSHVVLRDHARDAEALLVRALERRRDPPSASSSAGGC